MPIAAWSDEYYTGHRVIDQQHQDLFAAVNRIHQMTEGENWDRKLVQAQLEEFAQDVLEHFDFEESLMRSHQYPNYDLHRTTHQSLIHKVQKLLKTLDMDTPTSVSEVTQVLTAWMVHHVRGEDQNMIQFLRERNVETTELAGVF